MKVKTLRLDAVRNRICFRKGVLVSILAIFGHMLSKQLPDPTSFV